MSDYTALEKRLRELEDISAISALKYRYLNACDAKQPEDVSNCFVAGKIDIDFGHIGRFDSREAFVNVFEELGCHAHIIDMHHAQNPVIRILSEDQATGHIGLRFLSINTQDKTRIQLSGHYDDEYRRVDGEWKISASRFTVAAVEMIDFSGDHARVTYTGNTMPSL